MRSWLMLLALWPVLAVAPAAAQDAAPDKARLKELVREILRENPELVLEAIEALEKRERQATEQRSQAALTQLRPQLEQQAGDPVLGNPRGDVTLVEFFDYRCPYCKQVAEAVQAAVKADGKVRLVLKELPILGPASVTASQAALAAQRQGKYLALHDRLMASKGQLDEAEIMRLAAEAGLDVQRLKADMSHPEVEAKIKQNLELARALQIRGTPAFVAGDKIIPGAVDRAGLDSLIRAARKS